MVELILRLVLASATAYASRQFDTPPFEWAQFVTGGYAVATLLAALIGRRFPVFAASFQAMIDVAAVGILVGASGSLNTFGFLVGLPVVYAIGRRHAHPIVASAAGLGMYLGFMLFGKGTPALDFHAKALAITMIGCLAIPRIRRMETQPDPEIQIEALALPEVTPGREEELDDLRLAHAHLLQRCADLDRNNRRQSAASHLMAVRGDDGPRLPALAERIREVTLCEATAIYVRSESADDLVIQASSGAWPTSVLDTAIPLIPGEAPEQMRWAIESQVSSLLDQEDDHAMTMLIAEGRTVGMVLIRGGEDNLEELRDTITTILIEDAEADRIRRRAREAELMYAVASVAQGSQTSESLANRLVRELDNLVKADYLAIHWVQDLLSSEAARSGEPMDIVPLLSVRNSPGVGGWVAAGTPEIAAFRTMMDPNCDAGQALASRIGSFILIPLQSGHHPFGFLVAATHRAGGLDTSDLLTLRTLGIEISRAIARLTQVQTQEEGIVTPTEFHEMTRSGGAIIYIEPIHHDRLLQAHGRDAVDKAMRQFTHIVRGKLPATGIVCRRDQDDLLAFLSGSSHEEAVSWATEIQALASMIDLGGRPLAVRTKVAYLPNRVISAA